MPTIQSPEDYRRVFNEAEQLRHKGQIASAAIAYRNLLRYRLEWMETDPHLAFTINEFFIIDRLADISLLIGNKAAARHLLSALTLIEGVIANSSIRIHAVTKLMLIYLDAGQLDEAFDTVQSLSSIIGHIREINISPTGLSEWENSVQFSKGCTEQDEADQFVCLYDALGALLLSMGRFAESALLFKRAIQIGEKFRSPLVDSRLLSIKILLAKAFFQKGEMNLAKDQLTLIETDPATTNIASGIPFHLLNLKSRMAMSQGELGEAYRLLFDLTQLCHRYSLPLAEIQASFNLAQVKVILNQTNEATDILKDCLLKARELEETALASRIERFLLVVDSRTMVSIQPLNYIGSKQQPTGKPKPTAPAPPGRIRLADYMANFEEKALVFQLELAANRHDKASEMLDQLRALIGHCDSTLIHMRFHVLEFMLLLFANAHIQKIPHAGILDFFTANKLLPELWQFRNLLGRTDIIAPQDKPDWIKENQQLLDKITNSLPATMQALYLLNKWSPNEEYLASYSHQLLRLKSTTQNARAPYRWFMRWKLAKQLMHFQETANAYKSFLTHSVAKGLQPGDFSFYGLKASLAGMLWRQRKAVLVISFLVLPDRIVIISRSFLKVRVHITFINRVTLRQLVFALRDALYPEGAFREMFVPVTPASRACIDEKELQKHIGEILQLKQILEEHGKNIRDVSFIADDVLHGFPFTLFMLKEVLAEKTRIGISIDHRLRRQTLRFAGMHATLIGVSRPVAGLNALPGVLKEMSNTNQQLASYGATVEVILDEDATVEKAKQQLLKSGIVHFSCHGKFDYHHPEQSGLLMADGNMLTLKDILALEDLSHIRLLVLSSCRGAEHFILPGRWIIGLPETFCRAGVHAVLAFLWPVNDDFATGFTKKFYEHLKTNIPKQAFRLTILDAKNKNLPGLDFEYWRPRFWAGAMFYER